MKSDKSLVNFTFMQRENAITHNSYNEELYFYHAVQSGDLKRVKDCMSPLDAEGLGILSESRIRNYRYHLIIATALITRFCMEGGMNGETAYSLSDLYVQRADKLSAKEELMALHREMIYDFTKRMHALHKEKIYSKQVCRCLDYIYENLLQNISIRSLAEHVKLNPTYLATLFKKETGDSIAAYIRERRMEAAKNMLKYSEYSPLEISNYMSFSSHSYFIHQFKKYTGLTPKEYQNKYFRSNWK